eukprot:300106_1
MWFVYFLAVYGIIRVSGQPSIPTTTRPSGPCAAGTSYCLNGLLPNTVNDHIAAQYIYAGINDGCAYFTHISSDGVYLHWDSQNDIWIIGNDIYGTSYSAYCAQATLDQCSTGTWYVYDGTDTNYKYRATIEECHYDNTQCESQYNNTFSKQYNNENDFCMRRMWHKDTNSALAGRYSVSGCAEEEPYYTADIDGGFDGYDNSVITIAWDNELSAWFIGPEHTGSAGSNIAAYCIYGDNLQDCSGFWYIYDGNEFMRDSQVISGLCNTCTDTKYETYCIYGGITRNQFDPLVGIYTYDKCVELMHSYAHTTYDDWYFDDLYGNGTYSLTVQYRTDYNGWRVYINNNPNHTYAKCNDIDNVIQCSGNWSLYSAEEGEWLDQPMIESGICDIIYDQCFNRVSDESTQYLCITQDKNNEMLLDDSNGFYPYVAGQFKYLECDDKGFPIYVRHRDSDGKYLDETWYNYTRITFDPSSNIFSVHNTTLYWMYCRALLLDLCDIFWNFHNDATQEWVHSPSIRISKQKCDYRTKETGLLDTIKENWLYVVIGVGALLLCCICCVCFLYCRKRGKKRNENGFKHKYSNVSPQTPTNPQTPNTPPKTHQMIHSSSNHKVSYASTKKESFTHAPPSYNADYDTKSAPKYNTNYETNTVPKYNPNYDMEMGQIGSNYSNNNNVNVFNEGHAFGQVTYGNNDRALDVIVNDESGVAQWSKTDIIQWINGLGLSEQWKETALYAVRNSNCTGNDLMSVNCKQDMLSLFGIQNPMINSRLWKELKKIK